MTTDAVGRATSVEVTDVLTDTRIKMTEGTTSTLTVKSEVTRMTEAERKWLLIVKPRYNIGTSVNLKMINVNLSSLNLLYKLQLFFRHWIYRFRTSRISQTYP